jgi:hypothetical protein
MVAKVAIQRKRFLAANVDVQSQAAVEIRLLVRELLELVMAVHDT